MTRMLQSTLPLLALVVVASPAFAQSRRFDIEDASLYFGANAAELGDLDGDGKVEYLIADTNYNSGAGGYGHGKVSVRDGASGAERFFVSGDSLSSSGYALAGAGDVNHDGTPDFIVGTSPTWSTSYARVYSGLDGSVIWNFPAISSYFGAAVSGAGDVDGDGWDDVVVGDAIFSDSFVYEAGAVYVFSGQTGDLLHSIAGEASYEYLGGAVSAAGDVDGDGQDDFAAYGNNGHFGAPGLVRVFSGATGDVLHEYIGNAATAPYLGYELVADRDFNGDGTPDVIAMHSFGVRVYSGTDEALLIDIDTGGVGIMTVLDDMNGDGFLEVAAGHRSSGFLEGHLGVFSGIDGAELFTLNGQSQYDFFGSSVAAVDVDGDGLRDLVVGAAPQGSGGSTSAHVYVHVMGERALEADLNEVPVGGGTQTMTLDMGVGQANELYLLAGSRVGIWPGIPLGGFQLPLNPDGFFNVTLGLPGFLTGSLGVLDGNGQGQVVFTTPANTSLVGFDGHWAFATFSLAPVVPLGVSNPITFRLVD